MSLYLPMRRQSPRSLLTLANLSSPPTSGAPSKMGGAPRGRRGPWCLAQRTASAAASTAASATRTSTAIEWLKKKE